ncbi:hypothetical protein J3R82DRAFT_1870 [Butyriboletus roseoflavus]|nr:hypothetical protein J3R82DRAFT_1870 [Butyriboletus roseoflavus]
MLALALSLMITWHPSKYVFMYGGQPKQREGSPVPVAVISLFGGGILYSFGHELVN